VAAVATVNQAGYHRASLAEIAGRAGIAKSAVAYYFASKEGLLLEVVQSVFGAPGESVLAAVGGFFEPAARMRAYADAYVGTLILTGGRLRPRWRSWCRTAHGRHAPVPLNNEDDMALLRSIVRAGMEEGVFQATSLEVATGLAESVLDRAITLVQRDPAVDLGELRAHVVPFLFRALGAEDG
jgi:AcrR family transcriptional regulator